MHRSILIVAALALITSEGRAQTVQTVWKEDSIQSRRLGQMRHFRVVLPSDYSEPETQDLHYPVVVVLDAEYGRVLSTISNYVLWQSARPQWELPPMIIVGVVNGPDRSHDMFPPLSGAKAKTFPTAGGADAFAAFLISELLPSIRGRYRTLPFTVIAGHSGGGHFAVNVFANHPETFQGAIAASPALWVSDEKTIQDYASRIAKRTLEGRIFIAAGGHDPAIVATSERRLAILLKSRKVGVTQVEYKNFPEESHPSLLLPAFIDGLRWMFSPISLASNAMWPLGGSADADSMSLLRAYAITKSRYAAGANRLGLPPTLPASFLGFMAFFHGPLGENYGLSNRLCDDYITLYPSDAWAYECAGRAFLARADTSGARRAYLKGMDVARKRSWVSAETNLTSALAKLDSAVAARKP